MRYRFMTVDVFTSRRFAGNPLAVFPDARGLEPGQMQQVAREFNLSETTFVLPPEEARHTRRVRIFTPGAEVPFAGHPTVGTAWVLAHLGEIPLTGETTRIVLEEGVGPVPVGIFTKDGRPVASQLTAARLPEVGPPPPGPHARAAALSRETADRVGPPYVPEAVSCGLPFLFVPLRDRAAVARARLNRQEWERVLASYWATEIFLFAFDPELPGSDLHARMFAPKLGIVEDPATGSAVSALGGYLGVRDERADGTLRWVVEQGFEMGRPSLLELEIDKRAGAVVEVRVGGPSVFVSEGWMEV
jgi:trans-2,3-dihydro-3-hydroxyanthranilate isomerase